MSAAKGESFKGENTWGSFSPLRQAPPTPVGTAYPACRCLQHPAARDPGHSRSCAGCQGPLAKLGWTPDAAATSSLGLPVACVERTALPPVPNPPFDLPLPDLASPHTLVAITASRLFSSGQLCGAWAGVGAGSAEGKGKGAKRAPRAGRSALEDSATGTGAVGLELCPSPRQSAGTDFTLPRPQGRRPASRPCLAARGRGPRAWGRGRGETTTLEGEEETTIPSSLCAGTVEAAGRVGLLCSFPIAWGLPLTQPRCITEVAE